MEEGAPIQSPPVSPLLAFGIAPRRFSRRSIIIISVAAGIVSVLAITALLLSASFFIPKNTVFFATAAPHTLKTTLNTNQLTALPTPWEKTITKGSRWPVLFGLTQNGGKTDSFVIGPRWAVPKQPGVVELNKFLVRQSPSIHPLGTDPVVYRFSAFNFFVHSGQVQGWVNPALLFSRAMASSSPIFFQYKDQQLHIADTASSLNVPTSDTASTFSLKDADLSLQNVSSNSSIATEDLLSILPLKALGVTLHAFKEVPVTIQLRTTSSSLDGIELGFNAPLTLKEHSTLSSQLTGEHQQKQLLRLPDGSIAIERIVGEPVVASSTDLKVVSWHAPNTSPLAAVTPCGTGTWVARVSPQLLQTLLPAEVLSHSWPVSNALQVWRIKNELIICREK